MPRTEAGKRLDDLLRPWWPGAEMMPDQMAGFIDAIEDEASDAAWAESSIGVEGEIAEAVAAERERCLGILRDARNRVRTGDAFSAMVATLDEVEDAIVNPEAESPWHPEWKEAKE